MAGIIKMKSFEEADERWEADKQIEKFKASIHTEDMHDGVMRHMHGSYKQYVAGMIEDSDYLSDTAKADLITTYGITERDAIRKSTSAKPYQAQAQPTEFQTFIKNVNDGTIKVSAHMSDMDLNNWSKNAVDIGQKAYDFIFAEGYKAPNTSLVKQIDAILANSNEVAQYLRVNKQNYDDYEGVYNSFVGTVNNLSSLKKAVEEANKKFSIGGLDKEAESVKIKAKKDIKSPYDQAVDDLAQFFREQNAEPSDFDKLFGSKNNSESYSDRITDGGYKPSETPVSNSEQVELSEKEEKGNTTIYSGSIWEDSFEPDMSYANVSNIQLMKVLSPVSFMKNEKQHLNTWKNLVKILSDKNMQPVLMDMIDHFCNGKGADYSNEQLTNVVKYHPVTQDYMKDFSDVFKTYMSKYNGDYKAFAQSKDFRDALKASDVLISKYSYGGDLFDDDTWGGLTMAIHGWTESQVDVIDSFVIGNNYCVNLQFKFIDNFGLDQDDFREFGIIPGFESWYALQHNMDYEGRYQPFKTVVTIDYQIKGVL